MQYGAILSPSNTGSSAKTSSQFVLNNICLAVNIMKFYPVLYAQRPAVDIVFLSNRPVEAAEIPRSDDPLLLSMPHTVRMCF
jgi:hypothetical protein